MLTTIKNRELYEGCENFLSFVLKFSIKKHTGGLQRLWDNRRLLTIEEFGKVSIIHWNGTIVSLFDDIKEQPLHFV